MADLPRWCYHCTADDNGSLAVTEPGEGLKHDGGRQRKNRSVRDGSEKSFEVRASSDVHTLGRTGGSLEKISSDVFAGGVLPHHAA